MNCSDKAPPPPPSPALQAYWTSCVHELATVPPATLDAVRNNEVLQERHRICSLVVLGLLAQYWNGNKYGAEGSYYDRKKQAIADGFYRGATLSMRKGEQTPSSSFEYLGHNIACIAVDKNGRIIDFDFNHNEVFDSSVEHAESRLVRRVFSLAQVYQAAALGSEKEKKDGVEYSNILSDVTIYTSLESCAQCAGIMTLAKVKEVVYLQTDPGMYGIGNILYNFTHEGGNPRKGAVPAPLPIPANIFGLSYFSELDEAYARFAAEVGPNKADFFKREGFSRNDPSMTSFLCTDTAFAICDRARKDLTTMATRFPDKKPEGNDSALTNEQMLQEARNFFDYAIKAGDRGTAHKL